MIDSTIFHLERSVYSVPIEDIEGMKAILSDIQDYSYETHTDLYTGPLRELVDALLERAGVPPWNDKIWEDPYEYFEAQELPQEFLQIPWNPEEEYTTLSLQEHLRLHLFPRELLGNLELPRDSNQPTLISHGASQLRKVIHQ